MRSLLSMLLLIGTMLIWSVNATALPDLNFYLYNWEGAMKDTDGTLLKEDSRVELVWAGANGVIDDANHDTSGANFLLPGGDDVLLRSYGVGDGIPRDYVPAGHFEGHIEAFINALNIDAYDDYGNPTDPLDDYFYVRFFNAVDPVVYFQTYGTVGWGESDLFQLTAPDVFGFSDDVNFATSDIYVTTAIPEPVTIITLLMGLFGIKFFRRKD